MRIILVLYCCLFLIFIVYVVYILFSQKVCNTQRHLSNEHFYAHFSSICCNNYVLYPSLLLTSPMYLDVSEGESIWIPARWWHWVTSKTPTMSINFLCNKNLPTALERQKVPFKFKDTYQNKDLLVQKALDYNDKIENIGITNEDDEYIELEDLKSDSKKFMITLKGYGDNKYEKMNTNFLSYMLPHVVVPSMFDKNNVDVNFWYASGDHDTGLHYDDYNVLLTVVQGNKKIILYPPSDSKYLKPFNILPLWADTPSVEFKYNLYSYVKSLPDSLPSSRLLYEFITAYQNKQILLKISEIVEKIGINKLIYGCKLDNNNFRIELYAYHYNSTNMNIKSDDYLRSLNYNQPIPIDIDEGLLIHSIDLYNNDSAYGNKIHKYYKMQKDLSLPLFGYGTQMDKSLKEEPESSFFIDTTDDVKLHFNTYMTQIGFVNTYQWNLLLDLYKCDDICIFNKLNDHIFVMFLGIDINSFIDFLTTYKYPKMFVNHVKKNSRFYKNISHEIAIVFDRKNQATRTAFYGLV